MPQQTRWARVCILPDNDVPGRAHAEQVARSLTSKAKEIRVLTLPGLPEKGDVSDWFLNGGNKETLLDMAEKMPLWKLLPNTERQATVTDFRPNDTFAAEWFASIYGEDIRFDHTSGRWLIWDETKWRIDDTEMIYAMGKQAARQMRQLITDDINGDKAKDIIKFATRSEDRKKIADFLMLAGTDQNIAITNSKLDRDPFLFNCKNGTLALHEKNVVFHEHLKSDMLTKMANVSYEPNATCSKWISFISWLCCNDKAMERFLAQFFGICLTGQALQYLWFWYGLGANGKSVLWNTAAKFYGDYALKCPFDMLTKEKGGIPNDVARLPGVRLAICSEIPGGAAFNECLIKELTGGDRLTARFLHQEFFEFDPTHKILIVGNHRPRVNGGDHGIWRRILLVPFDNTVLDIERRDMTVMIDEFMAESSGILNWMLRGLVDFWTNKLVIPERARLASAEYRDAEDSLGDFLAGYTERAAGNETQGSTLYAIYKTFTETAGGKPMSIRSFYEALRERGFTIKPSNIGKKVTGLRQIKEEW